MVLWSPLVAVHESSMSWIYRAPRCQWRNSGPPPPYWTKLVPDPALTVIHNATVKQPCTSLCIDDPSENFFSDDYCSRTILKVSSPHDPLFDIPIAEMRRHAFLPLTLAEEIVWVVSNLGLDIS